MAATPEEVLMASDVEELPREMDGNLLRKEFYQSASLATKLTILFNDAGGIVSRTCEDI